MKSSIGSDRYQHYSNAELLNAYSEGYERLTYVTGGLSIHELKSKPIPGKWSIMEIAIHLTDAELVGACRFRLVLSDFEGKLPFYNQDDLAVKLKYNEQTKEALQENISLFGLIRNTSLELFLQCSNSDWNKVGIHPERGPMTLRALLELYADHSERHIEQILKLRNLLNKTLDLELLLKDRLY